MSTMTLETSLSVIDRSIQALREAGYHAQAEELTAARVPVSEQFAHLAQPGQAADVRSVVVKALGSYLEKHWPDNPVSYDTMADHITRALSCEKVGPVDGLTIKFTSPYNLPTSPPRRTRRGCDVFVH
jgi:hypothetical protein